MKNQSKTGYEILGQYDYAINDDFEIEEIEEKFAGLIGSFIIYFNVLENQLNVCIADMIQERAHHLGYQVVENLLMKNKIDLFYKIYLRYVVVVDATNKARLSKLKKQLEEVNKFRNVVVHGNWSLYTKKGFIRSRIVTDINEGNVSFKIVQIYKKDIKEMIKKIVHLQNDLYEYFTV